MHPNLFRRGQIRRRRRRRTIGAALNRDEGRGLDRIRKNLSGEVQALRGVRQSSRRPFRIPFEAHYYIMEFVTKRERLFYHAHDGFAQ